MFFNVFFTRSYLENNICEYFNSLFTDSYFSYPYYTQSLRFLPKRLGILFPVLFTFCSIFVTWSMSNKEIFQGYIGGSIGQVSVFSSGGELRFLGYSPASGSLFNGESSSLPPSVCSLSPQINK